MIDLHTHTSFSDGSLTPQQLFKYAFQKKIKYLAITDHDNCLALTEVQTLAKKYNIFFINGVELSCQFEGQELHLLGYGIKLNILNKYITIDYSKKISARKKVLQKMVAKLSSLGFLIPPINVEINLFLPIYFLVGCMVFSPKVKSYNEKVLRQRHGYVLKPKEFMERYLYFGGRSYVKREFPRDIRQGIKLIHKAKGIAVLAHPRHQTEFLHEVLLWKTILKIINCKIDGIEVYYPGHSQNDVKKLEKIALKYNLLITGGSDFHHFKKDKEIGYWASNKPISDKISIESLKSFL